MDTLARAKLLQQAHNNPKLQQALIFQCREDPVYWFNTFVWTLDPRVDGDSNLPFVLYPFQEALVQKYREFIEGEQDNITAKSRDMGVSWLVLGVFLHYWLFYADKRFKLGSRTEDYVDKAGDIDSLFERVRYMLRRLPTWMKPKGFDWRVHSAHMKLLNPVNGSSITGESMNPNFSRAGRFNAVLFDEFGFWREDAPAWTSAGHSTPCRMAVSTLNTKMDKFYHLGWGDDVEIRRLKVHWKLHPKKDDAWYENEQRRSTREEMAREVDIDPEGSSGTMVVPAWSFANLDETVVYNPKKVLYLTCDFNVDPMCWALAHKPVINGDNHYHYFDEIVREHTTIRDTMMAFVERYGNHQAGIVLTGDASGRSRSDMAENRNQTRYRLMEQILSEEGVKNYQVDVFRKNPNVQIRWERFNDIVCNQQGLRRVKVHPGCKQIVHIMSTARKVPGSNQFCMPSARQIEDDPRRKFDRNDMIDAAQYLVWRYDPLEQNDKIRRLPKMKAVKFSRA